MTLGPGYYFSTADLVQGPNSFPFLASMTHTIKSRHLGIQDVPQLLECPNLVVMVVCQGRQMYRLSDQDACVVTKRDGCTVLAFSTHGPTMMSGPYLKFLMRQKKFIIEHLHHIIIYKATRAYQNLFGNLIALRMNASSSYDADQMKLCCNAFIGMCGSFKQQGEKKPTTFATHFGCLSRQHQCTTLGMFMETFNNILELMPSPPHQLSPTWCQLQYFRPID